MRPPKGVMCWKCCYWLTVDDAARSGECKRYPAWEYDHTTKDWEDHCGEFRSEWPEESKGDAK